MTEENKILENNKNEPNLPQKQPIPNLEENKSAPQNIDPQLVPMLVEYNRLEKIVTSTPEPQPAPAQMQPPVVKDELISPIANEPYHEKILNLLKITNNKALNSIYHKIVPQISKNGLLLLDLTMSQAVFFIQDK